jgi:cell division protein FtsZ
VEEIAPVVDEIPPVVEEIAPVADASTQLSMTSEDEEPATEPFLLVKEKEQTSIEFDLTETPSAEVKIEAKAEETPVAEVKIEQKAELPPVNMDVKRSFISSSSNPSNDNNNESKVTKIADIQLTNVPPISDEDAKRKAQEKIQKLRELSFKVKTPGGLAELENEPAYKRKNVVLNDTPHSSESEISRLTLGTDNNTNSGAGKNPSLRPDNSFLHDRPD